MAVRFLAAVSSCISAASTRQRCSCGMVSPNTYWPLKSKAQTGEPIWAFVGLYYRRLRLRRAPARACLILNAPIITRRPSASRTSRLMMFHVKVLAYSWKVMMCLYTVSSPPLRPRFYFIIQCHFADVFSYPRFKINAAQPRPC